MNGIRNIQAITSAKVPIIKFVHYPTQIEADISLYNVLAQENTSMLRFYAAIDERVKVLGYMTKLFAKKCEIGDASRGSLSSYAYILMLIHYLQQCNPPVLPVLQELYDRDGEKPVNMVDGWNAWFFRDEKRLALEWRGIGQNKADILDLWLGFLRFYCQDFDERNLVVCIRQRPHLTKFEKMWNSHCIAIEDPFDLSHNLGAGISRKSE
jgi:terminal uridylyltransferase